MILQKDTISKEELKELPLKSFEGEIEVVTNYEQALAAANYLKNFNTLGFDTETKPSFKKGKVNKVALLQLSTQERAFLFRLNQFKFPQELIEILTNPGIIKAGVAIHDDIKGLNELKRFEAGGFVELQQWAKELGLNCFSLKKLSGLILGFRISKGQQLSNWEAEVLTSAQMAYAATDAWVSYELYKSFKSFDKATFVNK